MAALPTPEERAKDSRRLEVEKELAVTFDKIEKALPKIHALVDRTGPGRPPTNGFTPEKVRRAQATLQSMVDESLLTASGHDIRVEANQAAKIREKQILDGE